MAGKLTTSEASSDQVITDSDEVEKALGSSQAETSGSGDSVSTVYDVSAVAEAAMPSLVSITNMGEQEIQSFFGTYTQPSESSGTGIIIGKNDDELLIATNNHVVEWSEQLNVCFIDNEVASALVKGTGIHPTIWRSSQSACLIFRKRHWIRSPSRSWGILTA